MRLHVRRLRAVSPRSSTAAVVAMLVTALAPVGLAGADPADVAPSTEPGSCASTRPLFKLSAPGGVQQLSTRRTPAPGRGLPRRSYDVVKTDWRVSPAAAPGLVAVHRLYNPFTRDFLFTKSTSEVTSAIKKYRYTNQGIQFYASPRRTSCDATLVYSGYNRRTRTRHYATSRSALRAAGYTQISPQFYVGDGERTNLAPTTMPTEQPSVTTAPATTPGTTTPTAGPSAVPGAPTTPRPPTTPTTPTPPTVPSGDKPAAITAAPYLYTSSLAWKAYTAATDPAARSDFYNLAATPTSIWLGGSSNDGTSVRRIVADATARGTVAQFVFYAIPGRDCGGHASGGVDGAATYKNWVDSVVNAFGTAPAIVNLEPDAISFCNNDPSVRALRTELLTYAAKAMHDRAPNVVAYLHAGSGQLPWSYVVPALKDSGIAYLRGFAMNVASHGATSTQETYGDQLALQLAAAGVADKHYVVDTSRNGTGPQPNPGATFGSCNNANVALGVRPTSNTSGRFADAYMWVKPPGESDGVCHPGDPRGWWPDLARKLVANSVSSSTVTYWAAPS